MSILVTGATGGFGTYALAALKDLISQDEIFALARSEEKAASLKEKGFSVKIATYDDPKSLEQAFHGIDRLLFVSSSEIGSRQPQHKNVIDAAKKAGISYIAYTSFGKANTSTSPLAQDHAYTEKLILESGIDHTFLRNNWYLENEGGIITAALKTGKFVHAGGEGKAGWGLKREFAELAARAVSGKFDFPSILEVGGPLLTYQELAEALENVSGKKLEITSTDADTASQFLQDSAGFPKEAAEYFASAQEIVKSGSLAVEPDDMEKYLGKPLSSTEVALKELFIK
ncbi:MAG TPA: NmrA family NAD(P)-binding protein [Candidatus Tetragenococcus pullicola]|nr:NmrA family NAD(P)-binding protein [Candidatus Tetragenococcus pullicola]